ncbi:hypothetical protein CHLRE_07g350976v5 [Chlamydomonas reinhardtii]|uniref:Uncharacterized protein n=1 Tax=Chlamydomonas reinhardtii TaxID=3055 RepID=A0A2K3DLC9_CHLRE|nr:uncharacterized protein CHLRE_07g350976v5 [Chlamydomonas reinhardtii]PNW81321.1 hypothetical protein CHLRE_07g350976v5 [Chlamydomonas reinhardtii]
MSLLCTVFDILTHDVCASGRPRAGGRCWRAMQGFGHGGPGAVALSGLRASAPRRFSCGHA